ncbi:alpha-aminoadipic semialdehyde synthase mitochondrial [Fasciola gigantica]|uniref:Alpha-aminoadipic semialdehyde synthase mitochondrial n=1 Tax=Fasciola gigantica TaxID=46835 RepID=A0A504YZ46_FASGI|nr:alpha-aminoadipic semialdehyde synthase mitochondrial [Fasciola gigantica]
MAHELVIDWPNKKQREKRNVSLVAYGKVGQGKSGLAMSRTVGIPAAIAAKMILDGEITDKGIVLPLQRNIYKPILENLKIEGIEAQETSRYFDLP